MIPSQYVALGIVLMSILALAGALTAQYGFNLRPCELCLIQRVPFVLTIILAILAYFWDAKRIPLIALSGVAYLVNSGIALFHSGVERKWWAGLTGCTTPDMSGSIEDLMKRIQETAVVRCDEIPWSFLGLSMANYNVVFCLGLGALCLYIAYQSVRLGTR
ncbi:MAG: hypothetical protein A3J37_01345 [Alphaproteobacteria bacterium RIFCSPHIGHO2_12_FULL_45_9]|nr:MAG: hypothetical protein A3B66_06130 [Alphaproteobacteria bacterium RIFCSPHIGHO2_02_FULL_46_13]OFW98954.1 MAG: hypothetical protein A3J37_01345 [Alphaproteobacteria bacterium RIFCSPHIGHO2_12_FULL_45_9]